MKSLIEIEKKQISVVKDEASFKKQGHYTLNVDGKSIF